MAIKALSKHSRRSKVYLISFINMMRKRNGVKAPANAGKTYRKRAWKLNDNYRK